MEFKKYIKKPIIVEAVQYTGDNIDEIREFIIGTHWAILMDERILLTTPDGDVTLSVGDYIIKGIRGDYYPCKPDVFDITYNLYNDTK